MTYQVNGYTEPVQRFRPHRGLGDAARIFNLRGSDQSAESTRTSPTIGVEEEHFVVDPVTRAPAQAGPEVVARAAKTLSDSVCCEFSRSQVELKTQPCGDAAELRQQLRRLRSAVAAAAAAEGLRLCACGTPVVGGGEPVTVGEHPRYRAGLEQFRGMLDDFGVCAAHVHVHLPDRGLAVLVANHLRPWLPTLVALSANSPFCQGRDTGYATWRAVIRGRFPCLGPPPYAESLQHYEEVAAAIAESGAMLESALPFWDIRPNPRFPTIEIRCMDVVTDVDDTVALAMLVRALVTTALAKVQAGDAGPRVCSEVLRAAYWRAARDGWSGCGVDPLTGGVVPTAVLPDRLLGALRPALEEHGDTQVVKDFLRRLEMRGTGADEQRFAAARRGGLAGVVDHLIAVTAART
jgi:glutamate---cysteine ligase / carboxylate-amine ligase